MRTRLLDEGVLTPFIPISVTPISIDRNVFRNLIRRDGYSVNQNSPKNSSIWKFWIGRTGTPLPLNASETDKHHKRSSHREDLTLELKKLQNNTLQTVTKTFLELISNKKGLSIFSFNCQSLHAHAADLKNDAIVKKSNVLLLSEIRMKNEESLDIPNFNFVVSYKRPEVPAAGVAIYHKTQDTSCFITSHIDIHTKFTRSIGVNVSDIGEICIARC
ncbi:uncharacterized protein TNCV_4657131 [Trichonephila clavipes]|nr:uncharacterized protein TNCV_4657131 [Trichonephila clavipes]